MSNPLKILFVFAIIAAGIVLYLRKPPNQMVADPDARWSTVTSAEASNRSSDNRAQIEQDVWKAVAPCWNQMADRSTLSVKLTVSFDRSGKLASPPVIERNPSLDPTDQDLKSEALALQALAACGPYPMASGQEKITVVFPILK